jgi:hypothetical protein
MKPCHAVKLREQTVTTRLLIGAGGGGDDLAAAIIQRATASPGERAYFASYSWERLIVDPVPGPRDPSWFTGLQQVGERNYRITRETEARAPAQSSLPRLASELGIEMFLLDPRGGAVGMRAQLTELVALLGIDLVQLVDVGGDILAEGHEPSLSSPLADCLTLAAMADVPVRAEALVAGAGLDGELSEEQVLQRCANLGSPQPWRRLTTADVAPFLSLFSWYSSDVTGLLMLSAQGHRGVAELRDAGSHARMSDHSSEVYKLAYSRVLRDSAPAQAFMRTRTLQEVESALRANGRQSEIDYERAKAKRRADHEVTGLNLEDALRRLQAYGHEVDLRGATYVSLRRAGTAIGLSSAEVCELRHALRKTRHPQYVEPMWAVRG